MNSIAELQRQLANVVRLGTIAEVDLSHARCRVDTGEIRTTFVPWLVPRAGQTIEWSAPSVGEQVVLLCPGGDTHGGIILRGIYSDAIPSPSDASTRHLVRYPDGAQIEYDHATHALKATLPAGGTAETTASGGVTINGPFTVNGKTQLNGDADISGTATATIDVVGGGKSLKGHKHTGVTAGGGISGPPQ